MKTKVRFLLPVWGESYIKRFAALSLPSLIAPGNLPALAAMTDLELCILTGQAEHHLFEPEPAFSLFRRLAPFRFIDIDDLVLDSQYGVTLTFAYLKGIAETGARMLDQYFLLLNSDIVLADGSLQKVAEKILEGPRLILANSLRATAEAAEPALTAMLDREKCV